MTDFSKKLINWYLSNKRDLPWRETRDPYRIWLSEIILQQTRVEQGKPYYFKFVESFPDVFSLAAAEEDEVLKHWQGLGYYSRARNLHASAKQIAFEKEGIFPQNYKELKNLPGVGDYTASAIASICFDEPAAVVDGNVYRVLSRIFGIDTPIDSTAGKKEFKELAQELIDRKDPATFNQAIMEFGAVHCKPKNLYCLHCPFNDRCVALQKGKIDQLPVKAGKTKVRDRYFNYVVFITENGSTILNQREKKGIWRGLYEFPLLETDKDLQPEFFRESLNNIELNGLDDLIKVEELGVNGIRLFNEEPVIHKLSHQKLFVKFWIVALEASSVLKTIPFSEIESFAVPRVIDRFMEVFDFESEAIS